LLPLLPPPSNDLDLQSNAHQSSFWRSQNARERDLILINVWLYRHHPSTSRASRIQSKEREDLEQDLVRNHRHRCRLAVIDQRSNHRHRRDGLLHPSRSISMSIRSPCERVGKPLIGSNHMHSIACREGDETSMLVECNIERLSETAAIER